MKQGAAHGHLSRRLDGRFRGGRRDSEVLGHVRVPPARQGKKGGGAWRRKFVVEHAQPAVVEVSHPMSLVAAAELACRSQVSGKSWELGTAARSFRLEVREGCDGMPSRHKSQEDGRGVERDMGVESRYVDGKVD